LKVAQAAGHDHPAFMTADDLEMLDGSRDSVTGAVLFGYPPEWALPSRADRDAVLALMSGAPTGDFATPSPTSAA
jgi:hypothetical protein